MNLHRLIAHTAGITAIALVWWFGLSKGVWPLPLGFSIELVILSILFSGGFFVYGVSSPTSEAAPRWLRYGCAGILLIPFGIGLLISFAGHWWAIVIGGAVAGASLFLINSIPTNHPNA